MNVPLLSARLLVALVFVVSEVAKLADLPGSRRALRDFGVPDKLASLLGLALPLVDLAAAIALLPAVSAWWGAVGALALLLLFIGGIAANLAQGRRPACHCFGQLHAAPIGWSTLARNAALAALAGFVLWQGGTGPGPSAVAWIGAVTAPQAVAVVAGALGLALLALEAWLLVQMLRQQGRLLLRLDAIEARLDRSIPAPAAPAAPPAGLPVGSPAPAFRLDGLRGETLTLDALRAAGKPVLLVFSHPDCGPCQALLPELGRWQRGHATALTVAIIAEGTAEDHRAKAAELGLTHVLLQQRREVAEAYRAQGTPAGVVVRPDGAIGSPAALGPDAIRQLVAATVGMAPPGLLPLALGQGLPHGNGQIGGAAPTPRGGVARGQQAPTLTFKDLAGKTVSLASFKGSATLLLFWNPACGFCQQMLDDLRAWEARSPEGAPKLLVISTGDVGVNRALGLRSPVLLDEGFRAGAAFGAGGTPMAVLVDTQGRVASEVVAGAPAVLALASAAVTA